MVLIYLRGACLSSEGNNNEEQKAISSRLILWLHFVSCKVGHLSVSTAVGFSHFPWLLGGRKGVDSCKLLQQKGTNSQSTFKKINSFPTPSPKPLGNSLRIFVNYVSSKTWILFLSSTLFVSLWKKEWIKEKIPILDRFQIQINSR